MTVEGGKYKVKKSSYTKNLDPIDENDAYEMLFLIGGEEKASIQDDDDDEQDEEEKVMLLTFSSLEKWIMNYCMKSYFERHQYALITALNAHLMLFLERFIIASSCEWNGPGYNEEVDYIPITKVKKVVCCNVFQVLRNLYSLCHYILDL